MPTRKTGRPKKGSPADTAQRVTPEERVQWARSRIAVAMGKLRHHKNDPCWTAALAARRAEYNALKHATRRG